MSKYDSRKSLKQSCKRDLGKKTYDSYGITKNDLSNPASKNKSYDSYGITKNDLLNPVSKERRYDSYGLTKNDLSNPASKRKSYDSYGITKNDPYNPASKNKSYDSYGITKNDLLNPVSKERRYDSYGLTKNDLSNPASKRKSYDSYGITKNDPYNPASKNKSYDSYGITKNDLLNPVSKERRYDSYGLTKNDLSNPASKKKSYDSYGITKNDPYNPASKNKSYDSYGVTKNDLSNPASKNKSYDSYGVSKNYASHPASKEKRYDTYGITKGDTSHPASKDDTDSEEGTYDSYGIEKSDSYTDEGEIPSDFPTSKFTPQKVNQIEAPNPFTFVSPEANWQRVFKKYSPSTETLLSPVKHISANLCPNVMPDEILFGMVWVCGMSEQFYYDNGVNMLQKYFSHDDQLRKILRLNSTFVDPEENLKNLVDVHILGSGSFGDVYRVRNKLTDQLYAVKFLKKSQNTEFMEHTDSLLSYLKEKNFSIQARNSPYIVQFISSATYPKVSGLFLFFEWCLCDLRKFVSLVTWKGFNKHITQEIWDNIEDGITDLHANVHKKYNIDLVEVSVVYIFEIFCGLSFLADCNLVHQDLKPENIMISTTLHLKIADFGLAYNTKFITRRSQIGLLIPSDIAPHESANYKPQLGGTYVYQDMELSYRQLQIKNPLYFHLMKTDENNFQEKLTEPKNVNSDFLNDLWACGIMVLELLFGGIHPFYYTEMSLSVANEMGLKNLYQYDVLKITYNSMNSIRYIAQGFVEYAGPNFHNLMNFLITIFRPREVRALGFTKFKEVYRYDRKVTLGHIDINKVEEIDVFRNLNLHNHNSFLYQLPKELKDLLTKETTPKFPTMGKLLDSITSENDEHFFTLDPGIQQNFL